MKSAQTRHLPLRHPKITLHPGRKGKKKPRFVVINLISTHPSSRIAELTPRGWAEMILAVGG